MGINQWRNYFTQVNCLGGDIGFTAQCIIAFLAAIVGAMTHF